MEPLSDALVSPTGGLSGLGWVVALAPLGFVLLLSFRYQTMSEGAIQALFWGFAAIMGASMSTIFLVYTSTSIATTFFATAAALGAWLQTHGAQRAELIVGFYKVGSGRASITWPESVDEALCVGWIDGVRRRIDDMAYQIRFTPRKTDSIWSAINIDRVAVLEQQGRMQPAGRAAFAGRSETRSRTYAYEQPPPDMAEAQLAFGKHRVAWTFFEAQPPGYRQRMLWWVSSAKQPATRAARLGKLIEACHGGLRL